MMLIEAQRWIRFAEEDLEVAELRIPGSYEMVHRRLDK